MTRRIDTLENLCSDLMSSRTFEAFPIELLQSSKSKWSSTVELSESIGIDLHLDRDIISDLYVVWLDHPTGDSDYALIVFYDFETKWTMGAEFNRSRSQ